MARAVIMAGGEGTRLRPFTHTIPKPLLPIGRKPVAQIIIERLADHGFTDIVMSLGYAADLIRAYFQDGHRFGVNISYFHEPEKLGTAGCLAHLPSLREAPFLVTNGDLLTDLDYRDLLEQHIAAGAAMTVGTRTQSVALPYGVLDIAEAHANGMPIAGMGTVTGVREKPVHHYTCNAGIYALSPVAVDLVPPTGRSDMTDLIQRLLDDGHKVNSYALQGYWFDLAQTDDFDRALQKLEELGLLP